MQTIVITFGVLQQNRRRLRLAGLVAAFEEVCVLLRIADIDRHRVVPAIAEGRKISVELPPELVNDVGEWISKVFVFAASEAMSSHNHATAEEMIVGVKRRERRAVLRRQKLLEDSRSVTVEVTPDAIPIDRLGARFDTSVWGFSDAR